MIEIRDLTFRYGRGEEVFHDFNLTLPEGHVYGLLGRNGVGKSTLLHILIGLLRPRAGAVCIDGVETSARRAELLADCFLVPEEFDLPACTLSQYVALTAPFYPRFSREQLRENLALFDMAGFNPALRSLSMGQKKKVFMCFALAAGTKYLIMDEPTNGLDIPSKEQFRRLVTAGMRPDRTIIISTHQVADIESLLDETVIVERNRVLLRASVDDICRKLSFGVDEPGALYSQPFAGGRLTIAPNVTGRPSAMRLELLFNAVLANPEIRKIFAQ